TSRTRATSCSPTPPPACSRPATTRPSRCCSRPNRKRRRTRSDDGPMTGSVVAVHRSGVHGFSKNTAAALELVAGHGVRDDAHCGVTVKHRSRVAKDPTQPNLRQVHLLHAELFEELGARGFAIAPGQL